VLYIDLLLQNGFNKKSELMLKVAKLCNGLLKLVVFCSFSAKKVSLPMKSIPPSEVPSGRPVRSHEVRLISGSHYFGSG